MTNSPERDAAESLYEIYQRALSVLCEADVVLSNAPATPWLKELSSAHDELVFAVMPGMMRYRIIEQYPDLGTDRPEGPPDSQLDPDEQVIVDRLTEAELKRFDEALLSDCVRRPRKVARIIGTAFNLLRNDFPDVPLGLYSRRVQALAAEGRLDPRGDLDYMRFSEVRLARDPLDEVVDGPIALNPDLFNSLRAFRAGRKRTDLVEADPGDPSLDLSPNLERLAERLLQGIAENPSKRWVMAQFQQSLLPVVQIDEEGRKRFGDELENIMDTLGIESDDGLLAFYLDWC